MKVEGKRYQSVWLNESDASQVCVIDQRVLPHEFKVLALAGYEEMRDAIADMAVRGAPLIGVCAAFGMYLAAHQSPEDNFKSYLQSAAAELRNARPTAVNLAWAIDEQIKQLEAARSKQHAIQLLLENAQQLAAADVEICRMIGVHGLQLVRDLAQQKQGKPVQVLTHCNAGWLATTDWGTATSVIYQAFDAGIPIHVWVDETRPRNQGAALTAWELGQHGVPYTLITDNAGGHLMQNGMVDMVIVGTDRTTRGGDVANKIGTYLKALAADANGVPFFVALPSSSIDWNIVDGREIPIEERSAHEVKHVAGLDAADGKTKSVLVSPENAPAANFGFDITPRHLVTALITERGICAASEEGLLRLFPERSALAL